MKSMAPTLLVTATVLSSQLYAQVLSNGDSISITGNNGSEQTHSIEVPDGATNLQIAISGGSGDADLYTRFTNVPTTSSYDCRPYLSGNNESCSVAEPSAGTYQILVRAYRAFSGVTLSASYDAASGTGGSDNSGGGDSSGGSNCTNATLTLVTDRYGSETSWSVSSAGNTLHSGNGYSGNTTNTANFCLAEGSYTFTINDSYGDGICCNYGNGSYSLAANGTELFRGATFTNSESVNFTIGGSGSGDGSSGGSGDGSSGGSGDGTATGLSAYYQAAEGLSGYALKSALHDIIDNHNSRGYSALWTFYNNHELDNYYENDGKILDIYSERPNAGDPYEYTKSTDQCGSYSGEGSCYNREHSFPRSWFGGSEPMNSDVHHIFATDGYVNGRRSSHPYGEVGSASWTSQNGSELGAATSGLGHSGTVFEPIDEFKGDIARAYFYMATRYEDRIASWENNTNDSNSVLNGSSNQVFESWKLTMLLDWHNSDPVSQKEIDRNNAAQDHQGNRNPFVDHPELVGLIWSN